MSDQSQPERIPLREHLIGAALYAPIVLSRALPYRWRIPMAGWLTSRVLAPLAGYNKRVRGNLAYACPDLPKAEAKRLSLEVTNNAGRNMMELYSPEFREHVRRTPIEGPGVPLIEKARAEGRPILFVTGHFGSINATRVAMIEMGFPMGVFYRPMANRPFNVHYVKAMARISEPLFEQGRRGMLQMVKRLRSGGCVGILSDLNAHDGVPLEFFDKPALTSLATAEMALKYKTPLVPVWAVREANGLDFRIIVEGEIPASDAVTMTREFNARLEAMIRQHMGQWFWIHRRWKDGTGPLADRGARHLAVLEGSIED
jgi:KDO2-lipid IV(A) lauroyltransferase